MLDNISPITIDIEEFLDRPIFINQYTKLAFCFNKPVFIVTEPMIFQTNLPY